MSGFQIKEHTIYFFSLIIGIILFIIGLICMVYGYIFINTVDSYGILSDVGKIIYPTLLSDYNNAKLIMQSGIISFFIGIILILFGIIFLYKNRKESKN
jgi:hypothetical protein